MAFTVARFVDSKGNGLNPPSPMLCILKDGKPIKNLSLEEIEEIVVDHYKNRPSASLNRMACEDGA